MPYPVTIRPITVEILINGSWQNISPYFLQDTTGTINRGSGGEANSTPPTTMSLTLKNPDGRFTRENPTSPYYPYLQQSVPIRYSIEDNGTTYSRFYGEIIEWPEATLDVPANSRVSLEATGIFRRWQRSLPLISPLRRTTLASTNLVAYWPMEDEGANAQTLASGIPGLPAMDIKQAINVANYSGFACSRPVPTLGTGQVSGPIAPHSTVTPSAPYQYTFEFVYHTSAVGADDTEIASLYFDTTTLARIGILAHTNGDLRLVLYNFDGGTITSTSYAGTFTTNNTDVKIVLSLINGGADIGYVLSTLVEGNRTTIPSASGVLSSVNIGRATYAVFGIGNNANISVGHATVFTGQPANYSDVTYSFHAYVEERAGTRFARICQENNVSYHLIGDPALTPRMGAQPLGTILDVLQQCPEVDHSLVYESRDELGVVFLMRNALYNQSGGTRIGPDISILSTGTTTTAVIALTSVNYFRVGEKFQLRLASNDSLVEATVFTITDITEGASNATITFSPAAAASTGSTKEIAKVRAGLLALSYGDHELQPPARPVHDDRLTVNSIKVSRDGGSEFLTQQETGARSIQDPPNGIGIYPDTARLNLFTDGELAEHAYWLLNLGLNADARWPAMQLGLHSSGLVSRQDDVLRLDIGHRVTVDDMANVHIYDRQDQLVRGYTETFDGNRLHYMSLNGIPEKNYHVLKFDDSTLNCRWAASGTTLGEGITDTQTGSVAVSVGNSPWTTTAGHFPQDIVIGGERVTISANSGSVSTPALVGVGSTSTGDNASVTPGLPSGATSGDVVYILASIRTGSVVVPTNWTACTNTSSTPGFVLMRRVYNGSWSMPTVTFTGGSLGDTTLGQSFAFRGVGNSGSPISIGPALTSTSATHIQAWRSESPYVLGLRFFVGRKKDDWSSVAPNDYTLGEALSSTTGNDAAQFWAYRVDNGISGGDFTYALVTGGAAAATDSYTMVIPAGPQQFTISARSVNGVVKAHSAGEPIQIAEPFNYGL